MRQVEITTKERVITSDPGVVPKVVEWQERKMLGVFHDFATTTYADSDGIQSEVVAVVEDNFGNVHTFPVSTIRFINPISFFDCEKTK